MRSDVSANRLAPHFVLQVVKVNEEYGNVFSCVGQSMPSDISQAYWEYWTYDPGLSEEEVVEMIGEVGSLSK